MFPITLSSPFLMCAIVKEQHCRDFVVVSLYESELWHAQLCEFIDFNFLYLGFIFSAFT